MESSLIPGLTDDVAELCLSRIPYSCFQIVSQVCRRWRTFLRSEHFSAVRKLTGSVDEFMCVLMESQLDRRDGRFVKYLFGEVFDRSGNNVGLIPPVPGPFMSGFGVAVLHGSKIVFIGGYTRDERFAIKGTTIYASANVYEFDPPTNRLIDIYDPKTETWEELDSGQSLSVYSYTVIRNKVYFFDRKLPGLGVFDPEENSWSSVCVPRSPGGYWFRLGEWNNKVILIARLGGCKALTGDLDKENASKWRATHIKPSGSNATVVLINF
ncbi:hypothetical protein Bca4012_054945 [Brassica carinata]